jgi:hypothetical protein
MCVNCGFSIDEKICVLGDKNGPYFEHTKKWDNSDIIINEPKQSYYNNNLNYRRYYGNNQGRRKTHHVF